MDIAKRPFIATYCISALLLSLSSGSQATGVSPYLPINVSPILENEVERLVVLANMPNLTKPYSVSGIFDAMERIRYEYPELYGRLQLGLAPYAKFIAVTQASITGSYSDEVHQIPNGRGETTNMKGQVSLRAHWQNLGWLGVYVGGEFSEDIEQFAGSHIALGVDWAQLDIGYKDIWMSPFQGSAQLLSTNAENLPSISLSNNLPIEFLNVNWNYQLFLAEESKQPVQYQGVATVDKKPLLAGIHIGMQPVPWWSVGATRIFQFGGGKRPVSARTLAKAFFDPRGADNDASVDEESGNQLAALTSRIHFDGAMPFSFAVEIAGEDTNNNKSYQLGNTAITTGIFFPYFFSQNLSLDYEYSDWQKGWYVNNVYKHGYTNEGVVMGHWAMQDQHLGGTSIEGTSHFLKTQWQTPFDHVVSVILRSSKHYDATLEMNGGKSAIYKNSREAEINYTMPISSHQFTLGVYFGTDSFGEDFGQLKAKVSW